MCQQCKCVHRRYFLKIYFLPELRGGIIVSEVFSQMERKKLTATISVKLYKKDCAAISVLSIIYPRYLWRFVRKQTERR